MIPIQLAIAHAGRRCLGDLKVVDGHVDAGLEVARVRMLVSGGDVDDGVLTPCAVPSRMLRAAKGVVVTLTPIKSRYDWKFLRLHEHPSSGRRSNPRHDVRQ
jgi:hypothetical protein